ncbi:unnamed protein product [Aureobasidium uvarum]|uniref:Vps72/YL1 C-terminal domain-containing protein n=1 Tax=Aureobasidium uvarum TaxID=2773716 RepID=A0A9N8PRI1_9PEZI|nr:unnamed protein product [Aureobasidium uvarum]
MADQPPPTAIVDSTNLPTTQDSTLQPTEPTQQSSTPFDVYPQLQPETAPAAPPPSIPLIREQAQRSLIILEAFPSLEVAPPVCYLKQKIHHNKFPAFFYPPTFRSTHPHRRRVQIPHLQIRKKKEFLPPPPPKPVCSITAKAAKYKDPATGLAYQGLEAYKAIQRVSAGGCRWGGAGWDAWMGILGEGVMGRVARGVPECFVTGVVKRKEKEKEVKSEEGGKESVVVPVAATAAPVAPMASVTPAPAVNAPVNAPSSKTS